MKVVILAGGQGTRLAEATENVPKPMLEIGGEPILWHIMKHFAVYGHSDFVIALGYKGEAIKEYFLRYSFARADVTVSLASGEIELARRPSDDWVVELVDTGLDSGTGGRLLYLRERLGDEPFFLTYGDGVSDVNLYALLEHHRKSGKAVTVTAVAPPSQFGEVSFEDDGVTVRFLEKPHHPERWINGGFMIVEPQVLDLIASEKSSLETDVLEPLSAEGKVTAYKHRGFWACMDTLKDLQHLRDLWESGSPPWKTWND